MIGAEYSFKSPDLFGVDKAEWVKWSDYTAGIVCGSLLTCNALKSIFPFVKEFAGVPIHVTQKVLDGHLAQWRKTRPGVPPGSSFIAMCADTTINSVVWDVPAKNIRFEHPDVPSDVVYVGAFAATEDGGYQLDLWASPSTGFIGAFGPAFAATGNINETIAHARKLTAARVVKELPVPVLFGALAAWYRFCN